jgi:adenosine deaminase
LFFTPARHLAAGQRLDDIIAGLGEGLAAGDAETGTRSMLICDMDRAYGPLAGRHLVEELGALRKAGAPGTERILGIGMDSTELGVDPCAYRPAYALATRLGLRRTGHQGEDTPPTDVGALIDVLGAERIDHGLSAARDPALVTRLADLRVPLTMCPTSNVVIARRIRDVAAHPLPLLRAAGVLVTLNTDDPGLTDLDLAREYAACAAAWDWGLAEMAALALDGVEASWLDDSDARRIRASIVAAYDELSGRLPAPGPQYRGDLSATSLA